MEPGITAPAGKDAVTTPKPDAARQRNPRGQGHLLRRELIQAAKDLLADTGDPRELTLRAVAKRAGVAAPSTYRHFHDIDELKTAVVQACFADLDQARSEAAAGIHDPVRALFARAQAYCLFGLSHPGHYRLMFGPDADLPAALIYDSPTSPGRAAFDSLTTGIRDCQRTGAARNDADAFELAIAMWALEHGLVTLRLGRPHFPWPPLDDILTDAITHLLDLIS